MQVERAKASLGPEVMHVAYRIGEDSTGASAIFFRITLRDWATAEDVIADITGRVASILFDEIRPLEYWDCALTLTSEVSLISEDGPIPTGTDRWPITRTF